MAAFLAAYGCDPGETGTLADPTLESVEWVQRGIGVEFVQLVAGVRQSTLWGDTVYSFGPNGQDSTVIVGLRLEIYEPTGVLRATIVADDGWMQPARQLMEARGRAVLQIPAQERQIESDTMYFDPKPPGLVKSDHFTRMIDPEKVICGTGFVSDLDFMTLEVSNPMTGQEFCRR